MGQLWVKLDELKRENEILKKSSGKHQDEKTTKGSQCPGEVIIAEMQKLKTENEELRTRAEKAEKTVKEMEVMLSTVQDQYKSSKVALDTTQKSLETILRDNRHLEVTLKSTNKENDTLKHRYYLIYTCPFKRFIICLQSIRKDITGRNQISLVHNHDTSGNKCYPQDNTNTWETQVCEYVLEKSKQLHLLWPRTRRYVGITTLNIYIYLILNYKWIEQFNIIFYFKKDCLEENDKCL